MMSEPRSPQTLAEASKEFHDACMALFWGVVTALRVQEMVDAMTRVLVALNRWRSTGGGTSGEIYCP